MARNQHAGPSTLRNRNRVTNKTRLKIIKESIDADPIVLNEDEEKARVVSTAGVDAEDANEHHLQAVLSAAATRHQASARSTRGSEKEGAASSAYIPTPDSTGKVDNYEELYPPARWKDPVTYVKSSDTIEESVSDALANGFVYYMDERDEEWLEKNNEEARGEGTSVQGAVSSTRSSRNTKKGKEPEGNHSVHISENVFELVMAIFEKITHEKTEFLHHGLEAGSPFPPFSDYQDTFIIPLQPDLFAVFNVPSWIPQPPQLLQFAVIIYPHWKERRIERGGHPIIPVVNLDETDTKNESYICFRRRESKAIRKTRAQQATYSDKMSRLQSELDTALELAKNVLQREELKQDLAAHTKRVWESRFSLIDLKRKFPSLGAKEDEELFHDKERVPKRIKVDTGRLPIKLRTRDAAEYGSPAAQEPITPPKERFAHIRSQIEMELARRKERDQSWENVIDNSYQAPPVPYTSRLFKYISSTRSPSDSSTDSDDLSHSREPRAYRLRVGRGGRMLVDRRLRRSSSPPRQEDEDEDTRRRLKERWAYDADDDPAVGPEGPDEHGRKLLDDYAETRLCHTMTLIGDHDISAVMVDPMFYVQGPEGRMQPYIPYRLGVPQYRPRSNQSPLPTPGLPTRHVNGSAASVSSSGSATPVGTRQMPPPNGVPSSRTPSNGILRPPVTPTVPAIPQQTSPQHSPAVPNGVAHDINGEQEVKLSAPTANHVNAQVRVDDVMQVDGQPASMMMSPVRAKTQTPSMTAIPNGFTIPSVNYTSHITPGSYAHHVGMRGQGMKSALVSLVPDGANGQVPIRQQTYSVGAHAVMANSNYSAQIAAARQIQYSAQQNAQRPITLGDSNGLDAALTLQLSPTINGVPPRTPSAAGNRSVTISRGLPSPALAQAMVAGQGRASPSTPHMGRMTPHPPHSPPNMLSPGLSAAQPHGSPPRPQPPMPSPSLQARQIVGSSGGY